MALGVKEEIDMELEVRRMRIPPFGKSKPKAMDPVGHMKVDMESRTAAARSMRTPHTISAALGATGRSRRRRRHTCRANSESTCRQAFFVWVSATVERPTTFSGVRCKLG